MMTDQSSGRISSCRFSSHCFGSLDIWQYVRRGGEGQLMAKVAYKIEWGGRASGNKRGPVEGFAFLCFSQRKVRFRSWSG